MYARICAVYVACHMRFPYGSQCGMKNCPEKNQSRTRARGEGSRAHTLLGEGSLGGEVSDDGNGGGAEGKN